MRLGTLNFGTTLPDTAVIDTLTERDVDIVRGEVAITDFAGAKTEAERIARADCDGVALVIGDGAHSLHAAHAAQFISVPLLVVAVPNDAFFASCGALAEAGINFERFSLALQTTGWNMPPAAPPLNEENARAHRTAGTELLNRWLESHSKTARQAGVEAVSKLYGQTLRIVGTSLVGVDAAQWRQQFGISLIWSNEGAADIVAGDGNPNRALCRHLLHLVSGQEVTTFRQDNPLGLDATFAQLYRVRGKFHLHMFVNDSRFAERRGYSRFAFAEYLIPRLFDSELYGVLGDVRPALRAACEGLDITIA